MSHGFRVTLVVLSLALLSSGCSSSQGQTAPTAVEPIPESSPFSKIKIGMPMDQVFATIGQPTSQSTTLTPKQFIPLYYGSDTSRTIARYKSQGYIVFSQNSPLTTDSTVLSINYDATEPGYVLKPQ